MEDIIDFLEENELNIISIENKIITVSYKFDLVEIDAARAYSKDFDESQQGEEYKQYLEDIAFDNLSDIIDDMNDEFSLNLIFEKLNFNENESIFVVKIN
ncbi:MAG: hypothetical protein ACRC57_07795 [Sarcina sp.]